MSKREPPAGYMNTAGIAKVLNITTRRVQQLTKEGIITKEQTPAGGYYNLGVTLKMYLQNLREAITERETKTKQNEKIEDKKIDAETRAKRAKAGKAELALEDIKNGSHRSEDAKAITTDLILVIIEKMRKMQKELAKSLVDLTEAPAVSHEIDKKISAILEELSEYKYDAEKADKRRKEYDFEIEKYTKE